MKIIKRTKIFMKNNIINGFREYNFLKSYYILIIFHIRNERFMLEIITLYILEFRYR